MEQEKKEITLNKKIRKQIKKFAKLNAKVWKERTKLEENITDICVAYYGENKVPTSIDDAVFDLIETLLVHENEPKKFIKRFKKLFK